MYINKLASTFLNSNSSVHMTITMEYKNYLLSEYLQHVVIYFRVVFITLDMFTTYNKWVQFKNEKDIPNKITKTNVAVKDPLAFSLCTSHSSL